jgi:CRISPR-associated protein Cmr2
VRSTDGKNRNPSIRPFEIITVGGDDALVIVPANEALQVAYDLVSTFEQNVRQGLNLPDSSPTPVSLSVGIAIGRDSTPARLLQQLAAELLKRGAKTRRFERNDKQGYIDFHDITREGLPSPSVSSYRDQRQYRYTWQAPTGREFILRTTGRPYSVEDLARMMGIARTLEVPTSQLYGLSHELGLGQARSTLYYLYQRSRLKDKSALELLERQFGVTDLTASEVTWPWIATGENGYTEAEFYTPLRDLILLQRIIGRSYAD